MGIEVSDAALRNAVDTVPYNYRTNIGAATAEERVAFLKAVLPHLLSDVEASPWPTDEAVNSLRKHARTGSGIYITEAQARAVLKNWRPA